MERMEAKEAVKAALKDMRSLGYITRMNFMCCGSCAAHAVATLGEERIDKGQDIKGSVFYNRQGNGAFEEMTWGKGYKSDSLYLSFGNIGTEKHGDVGHPDEVTGALLFGLLKARGLNVEWDFNAATCVIIHFEPE